ncbi:MAG: tetratricopeptide repeat protein [Deltaproteobacteria bacterium]|nr:tetratricopeptide repeat protein [Deltaproteobacteria bacterium]
MRSQKRLLLSSSFLFTVLAAGPALAQRTAPAAPSRSSTQFTLHREEAGGPESTAARQKARGGDCAGALPQFDAAIRVTIEPTLRRDRGLCHEKLGDPFPAIDDYRAYLVARPDAPDADQIRERLIRLEESVGVGGRLNDQPRSTDEGSSNEGVSASISANGSGVKTSTSSKSRKSRGLPSNRSYDAVAAQERLEEAADESPLRYGEGFILGPYLQLPRWFSAYKGSQSLFFAVGLSLRYAWSETWTFVGDIGYAGLLDRGVAVNVAGVGAPGGVQTFVGFEGRIPLDTYSSNQLYLGIGPGYEYLTAGGSGGHFLLARARFGYRHVFGSSIALDIGADGGGGGIFGSSGGSAGTGVVAANVAFVVGF